MRESKGELLLDEGGGAAEDATAGAAGLEGEAA